jgi:hypothetical protein
MSTLFTTASTSVRASHNGLPVSRAIRSAKSSILPRTHIGEAAHRLDPHRQRLGRPGGPGRPRPRNRLGRIADRPGPQLLASRRLE